MKKNMLGRVQLSFFSSILRVLSNVVLIIPVVFMMGCSVVTTEKIIEGCGSCEPLKFDTKTTFRSVKDDRIVTLWSEPSGKIKYETLANNSKKYQTGTLYSVCIRKNEWIVSDTGEFSAGDVEGVPFVLIKKDGAEYSWQLPDLEKFQEATVDGRLNKAQYFESVQNGNKKREITLDVTCTELVSFVSSCPDCFGNKNYLAKNGQRKRSMPSFILPSVTSGKIVNSDTFKDKVLLVTLFASWNPQAKHMVPSLIKLQKELSGKPFSVLCLSIDENDHDQVAKLAQQRHINYPVLMADNAIINNFSRITSVAIPISFLIDKQGNVVKIYKGIVPFKVLMLDISKYL